MGWTRHLAFMRYGNRFKKHRRLVSQVVNSRARLNFRPSQLREARTLVRNIVTDRTGEFEKHLTRWVFHLIYYQAFDAYVENSDLLLPSLLK